MWASVNDRLHVGKRGLGELILGGKQGLLCLKNSEQIGNALTVLKLRYLEGFAGSFHLSPKMNLRFAVVGHLAKRILHISISIEHRALIARDQFSFGCLCEVFLSTELAAVEDRLQEIHTEVPGEIGAV